MRSLLLAALPLLAAAAPTPDVPRQALTIDRIFASPPLSGPTPRGAALSPDGALATLLLPRADDRDRYDLWAVDTATGAKRMLVDSLKVGSGAALSEAEKMRRERARVGGNKGIVDYHWAPDGKSILVPIDGDLYLATLDGHVRKLTSGQSVLDPHVSEAGRYVSFVRDQNLHAIDLASGVDRALTAEGGGTITCGTAEFVAQEEMDRFTGAWWAPDDGRVAVECYDEAKVKTVTRTAIGADGARTFDQRYPAAGTPNVAVSLSVMAADGSHRVKVDLGADPDIYVARVAWAPDGRILYVQREARDQKRLDMLAVDPATGASKILFSETSKSWIDLTDDFRPLRDGSLIWGSARTGYMHLYRFVDGRWTQLTHGDWTLQMNGQSENTGLIGVDEARHRLFFVANKDTPLESQVYTIDYLHPGEPERLTERGYWNSAAMDKAATHMLVGRSSPDQPPQVYLADATGKRLGWIEENRLDAAHPYAPYLADRRPVTYGTLKAADGSPLYYEMITPKLEPGKRYPVFFEHYGGPGIQTVTRSWGNPLAQYWVSRGWIYFALDNRGSSNRGVAFESQIYHAMGGVEVQDQATGARWLQRQPFVDPAKIATYGWSYGGYMTLRMLEQAPSGLYAAGVAVAPVTKWDLYDTHYTERYLGNPAVDAQSYAGSSALAHAIDIDRPLLLVHGLSDDNVVFENSAALISLLQAHGKPFDMMLYVGQTHAIDGPGRRAHVFHTIENFLDDKVLGQAAK
ncbi:MAG TPA: DPP IV N-terminal domain-containing protein [Sphingomonas sp.]